MAVGESNREHIGGPTEALARATHECACTVNDVGGFKRGHIRGSKVALARSAHENATAEFRLGPEAPTSIENGVDESHGVRVGVPTEALTHATHECARTVNDVGEFKRGHIRGLKEALARSHESATAEFKLADANGRAARVTDHDHRNHPHSTRAS